MRNPARRLRARAASALVLAAVLVGASAAARAQGGPLPETLSKEARAALSARATAVEPPDTDVPARRAFLDRFQQEFGARQRRRYAVDVAASTMAGVPVRVITAKRAPKTTRILLNLHGGGFTGDAGSLTENIPIAARTGIPVVAVLYRLAPEHPFPAGVEDGLAVYRELLKTHRPEDVGIYGTSAGAVIGPQLIARLRKDGLPTPAVLGMFSGAADLSTKGDTQLSMPFPLDLLQRVYLPGTAPTDPAASPLLGDLRGFPRTLCVTSSRDVFLSATANFCRGLEAAGVDNKLVVFDGLPHAFWAYLDIPESDQAFEIMARFLRAPWGRR